MGWNSSTAFVDGHVHIYPEVPLARVLAAVLRHTGEAPRTSTASVSKSEPGSAQDSGDHGALRPSQRVVLALADPCGIDGFGRIRALGIGRGEESVAGWAAERIDDRQVELRHEAGVRAVFLRGQQLVTEEGLEVLAFGTEDDIAHGASLARTLDRIRTQGGWATIAWGAGKWLGRRGRLVTEAIRAESASRDIALGDNGGRPRIWSFVPQFHVAVELGMPILPGSDPLRIPGDEARIASYGFEIETPEHREGKEEGVSLAQALRSAVANRDKALLSRGRRVAAATFVKNQWRLRAYAR